MHIKLTNGVPTKYTLGQFRRDNPNVSFPKLIPDELLADYDVYPYTTSDRPAYDRYTQLCVEGVFEQDAGGAWSLPWVVESYTQEEAERSVRSRRDDLLQDTDWVVTKAFEADISVPTEWFTYRQALRDVPAQVGFPYNVTWPTKP